MTMKTPPELIKSLIESRSEIDRIYIQAEATSDDDVRRLREFFARSQELSRQIDQLIDAEINGSYEEMRMWLSELAPVVTRLKKVKANIEGIVTGAGLVDQVLKIAIAIVALIVTA